MAHPEQIVFCKSVKDELPSFFKDKLVIDIGSLDINGSNNYLFDNCVYLGLDLAPGKNVDFVSKGHELNLPNESVDTIISTECFEHDPFYDLTIQNIIRMLKPGGLFVFTCATTGRPEHGTRRTSPDNAPLIQDLGEWGDYYKNLEEGDIRGIVDIDKTFKNYAFSRNDESHDLYFWGIKNGDFVPDINGLLPIVIVKMLQDTIKQNTELNAELMLKLDELNSTLSKAEQYKTEIDRLREEVVVIRNTLSWRITKPLRIVRGMCTKDFICLVVHRIRKLAHRFNKPFRDFNVSKSIATIVNRRLELTKYAIVKSPLLPIIKGDLPRVDISVVTYNSARWIEGFISSLVALDYDATKVNICFVDNNSSDDTLSVLESYIPTLEEVGYLVCLKRAKNRGFGAGHNIGLGDGSAEFCLVTNIDLEFTRDALLKITGIAKHDDLNVATWEFRQKPYEHPKYYDPVTGLTNWNSHACVLIRRSAFEHVNGYDESIFMYGEDVELSYRLRNSGFLLKYCPSAVVYHYSYDDIHHVKPLQYTGSIFANLYLRLKYGTITQVLDIPGLMLFLVTSRPPFKDARAKLRDILFRVIKISFKTLLYRKKLNIHFSFEGLDYDFTRYGSDYKLKPLLSDMPLVSVITRTYKGREVFLRQAILSVVHQTYPNIEHIVVEDGGDSMRDVVGNINIVTGLNIKFIQSQKFGRSGIGNIGLGAATGKWCVFLDDDDLFFCDHVEILVNALLQSDSTTVAAYSLGLEVITDYKMNKDMTFKVNEHFIREFSHEDLRDFNYIPIQAVLFKKSLFDERGGFDEDVDYLEDWILWNKYAQGNSFVFVAKCTSMFRTPFNQSVRKKRGMQFQLSYAEAVRRINIIHPKLECNANKEQPLLFPNGHFYSPVVDIQSVKVQESAIWNDVDVMPGIDLCVESQLALIHKLKPYVSDILYPIDKPTDETVYYYSNDQYPCLDAEFLYCAIRHYKPSRIIEIGSGFSSLITADVNRTFFDSMIEFICIEPYPRHFLRNGVSGISQLIIKKVEEIDISFFDILEDGDVLLIDSSHVAKTGSDVNYLFFEILPRLKSGVIVHIHDIFLPYEYPKRWVIEEGRSWNEQYILRSFLQFNNQWRVLWSANLICTKYAKVTAEVFSRFPTLGGGGSFWIQRV